MTIATVAGGDAAQAVKVKITLTPDGCAPEPPSVAAGNIKFDIENKNADAVSEAELRTDLGSHLLQEREFLTPGLSGSFTVNLHAGSYKIFCGGAKQETWGFRVTGADTGADWHDNPELASAVNGYQTWVKQQVGLLATHTRTFVAAVKASQIDQAKVLYAKARVDYERVEPVAEAFGDLDKEIDGRIDDFPNPADFSGFHRIERALFTDQTVSGMAPFADGLLKNINQLQTLVAKQMYSPVELASGATDLVNEIEESKITGEEERYSGIDLIDFRGNLDGAMEVVQELMPYLTKNNPELLNKIEAQDKIVEHTLGKYVATPGYVDSGYVVYSSVTTAERKQLSQAINALAEAISEMDVVVSKT